MNVQNKKVVVFANGIFDLLHPGHIKLLMFAKSLGDKLIVGLNSDRVTKILKGNSRPIQDENSRREALENLSFVDEVVILDDVRTANIVRNLKPNIVVKGNEYTIQEVRKTDSIPESIEIVTFPIVNDSSGNKISTTSIIEGMINKRV
jgi:D-beta-D-heptose 7-phosphate kinase/D-beta-D-heptose 1-phosphate adenosyltransferase